MKRKMIYLLIFFKAINSAVLNRKNYESLKAPCCNMECCCSTCSAEDCRKSINQQQLLPMNPATTKDLIFQPLYFRYLY